jgi:hypothetical protein
LGCTLLLSGDGVVLLVLNLFFERFDLGGQFDSPGFDLGVDSSLGDVVKPGRQNQAGNQHRGAEQRHDPEEQALEVTARIELGLRIHAWEV